ncbi:MAG: VWA domain-containing protein [Acidimicrobiia bacterium]|nr:VWA domain-containing protein [Acidimicrobiia bacterium]
MISTPRLTQCLTARLLRGQRLSLLCVRRLLGAALMSCILVGASGAAQATAATSEARTQAPEASATDSALDEMAACLRSREHLLLVLLIDESGSLRSTDPQNERVTAARLALRSFASLSSTRATAEQPQIEVLVAGFSSSFDAVTPWTALDDDSVGGVEVSVDAFAGRDDGIDTDFPVALIGARRELASRSAELSEGGDAEPCKAILLFTDGRYDVETGDTPARREAGIEKDYAPGVSLLDPASGPVVEAAGRDLLCRTDGSGLADRLRADGAAVVTVALAAQIDAADQDFLRALSTGSSGTLTCGDPAGENAGAYLAAEELSELAPAFARVATSIAGATEAPGSAVVETCNGTECESGRRAFDLDPILLRFSVLADTRSEGTSMAVRAPHSADPVVVVPGTDGEAVLDGVALRWSWVSDTAVELNADLPAGRDSWIGEWSVTFVDPDSTGVPDRPRADVFLYGGWTPDLPTDTNLLRGAEADLVVVVIDAAGTPVGGEALTDAGARLDATVTDPTTDETVALRLRGPDAQGRYRAKYTAGADITASTLDLDLRLIAQTATGVELSPSTARYQLEVGLPDLYPHVTTPEIRLTSVRGTGTARGTVDIVGGRDRPGCVWFEPPEFESFPAEAVSLSYELSTPATAEDCIELVPGETRHVDIFIRPTASSEGTVRGALTVFLSARGESEPLSVVVPSPSTSRRRSTRPADWVSSSVSSSPECWRHSPRWCS